MSAFRAVTYFFICLCALFPAAILSAQTETRQEPAVQTEGETAEKPEKAPKSLPPIPDWIVSFGASFLFLNEDGGVNTAPAPLLFSPRASFDWIFFKHKNYNLTLHNHAGLYGTNYQWYNERPYPAEIENRGAFVFGFFLGAEARALFRVSRFFISAGAGLSADLRIAGLAFDLSENDKADARAQADRVRGYFWEKGRFLYPSLSAAFETALVGGWHLGAACTVWLPLVNALSGETRGLEDWRVGFGLTFSRHLFKKEKEANPPEEAADSQPKTPAR